jgi:hypothetical protein
LEIKNRTPKYFDISWQLFIRHFIVFYALIFMWIFLGNSTPIHPKKVQWIIQQQKKIITNVSAKKAWNPNYCVICNWNSTEFFVRFSWSESAFQFLVLLLFFLRFRSMNNYEIDRLKYEFFSRVNKSSKLRSFLTKNSSIDRSHKTISKIEKRNPKIVVHPKIHLKSHQFQSDKWKFQFTKSQSAENSENLQTSK